MDKIFLLSLYFFIKVSAEQCYTPDNQRGEITTIGSCPTLFNAFANPKKGSEVFLSKFIVDSGVNSKVCCTNQLNDGEFAQNFSNYGALDIKPNNRNRNAGWWVKGNIPWLAAIRMFDKKYNGLVTVCSGTLVNSRYVLTAAQCILQNNKQNQVIVVRFKQKKGWDMGIEEEDFGVEEIIPHPFYNILPGLHDIAILRLNRSIPLLGTANEVLFPIKNYIFAKSQDTVYTSSWANVLFGIHTITGTVLSDKDCENFFSQNENSKSIAPYHLCTLRSVDTSNIPCSTEVGGPVMIKSGSLWYIVGIVSTAPPCTGYSPELHTSVTSYLDWIKYNMRPFQEPCTSDHFTEGECVPLTTCAELDKSLANTGDSCVTEQTMCCGRSTKLLNRNSDEATPLSTDDEGKLPNKINKCGIADDNNVYYVEDDKPIYKLPWLAEVRGLEFSPPQEKIICGGVIISNRYVLTTANCLNIAENWLSIVVRYGKTYGKDDKECETNRDGSSSCRNYLEADISKLISHPLYDGPSFSNDIGLIKLTQTIDFTDYVQPICILKRKSSSTKPGDKIYVYDLNDSKLKKPLTITASLISNEECRQLTRRKKNWMIDDKKMCSSGIKSSVSISCADFPGATIMINEANRWHLIGTSVNNSRCKSGLPNVHLKIEQYVEWINDVLQEDRCSTGNIAGDCVLIRDCPAYLKAISNPRQSEDRLKKFMCIPNKKGDVKVCCSSTANYEIEQDKSFIKTDKTAELLNVRLYCGYQTNPESSNNRNSTDVEEFPWLAYIRAHKYNGEVVVICTSSIIDSRYILTAAKCISNDTIKNFKRLSVRLGKYNSIDGKGGCSEQIYTSGTECQEYKDYAIETLIPHSFYDGKVPGALNNIGLIKLVNSIIYTDYIRPICLPQPRIRPGPGSTLYEINLSEMDLMIIKKKIPMTLISNKDCKQQLLLLRQNIRVSSYDLCSIHEGNNAQYTCTVNEGGAVMSVNKNQWSVQAISTLDENCVKGYPGLYPKVVEYLDWIYYNINAASQRNRG